MTPQTFDRISAVFWFCVVAVMLAFTIVDFVRLKRGELDVPGVVWVDRSR